MTLKADGRTIRSARRRVRGTLDIAMEIAVFVVALALVLAAAVLWLGRVPFPTRRRLRADDPVPPQARTAEPPGEADDSG